MAQQEIRLDRDSFSCPICLDLLEDPVTIGCGHTFCMSCIKNSWDDQDETQIYSCPQCRRTFTPRPFLQKSIMLADVVEELKKPRLQAAPAGHGYARPEDSIIVCTRRKLTAVKTCLDCFMTMTSEISELRRNDNELRQLTFGECSHRYCCRSNYKEIAAALWQIKHELHNIVSETETDLMTLSQAIFSAPEPKTRADFLKYARKITLDPNTAHKRLLLSEGNRRVTLMWKEQRYADHPHRFTGEFQVLSRESLTGRCYWEVERGGRVSVAVTYEDISRVGRSNDSSFGCNANSWKLHCHDQLMPETWFSRLGVYLDHTAGVLSFYSVSDSMTLLHTVKTTFTQPLHFGIQVHLRPGNTAKLCEIDWTQYQQ